MIATSETRATNCDILIVSNVKGDRDWICGWMEGAPAWRVQWVRTAHEMLDVLQRRPVPVVVCRKELPDSKWKTVLITVQELKLPPSVIVLTDAEDIDLWTEVLNQGGFDTVHRGAQREAMLHTLRDAYRRWKRKEEIIDARRSNPASVNGRAAGDGA